MKLLLENWRKYIKENNSASFVEFLKALESPQERPSGFKKSSLKGEKLGKLCCWCSQETLVGVEHIIPRSAGGPTIERWNLAWACYPCNHSRGSAIEIPPRPPEVLSGWLTRAFREFGEVPTPEELRNYFVEKLENK
jgi:5-methylcytosine-specific restriction endonuclease McrA